MPIFSTAPSSNAFSHSAAANKAVCKASVASLYNVEAGSLPVRSGARGACIGSPRGHLPKLLFRTVSSAFSALPASALGLPLKALAIFLQAVRRPRINAKSWPSAVSEPGSPSIVVRSSRSAFSCDGVGGSSGGASSSAAAIISCTVMSASAKIFFSPCSTFEASSLRPVAPCALSGNSFRRFFSLVWRKPRARRLLHVFPKTLNTSFSSAKTTSCMLESKVTMKPSASRARVLGTNCDLEKRTQRLRARRPSCSIILTGISPFNASADMQPPGLGLGGSPSVKSAAAPSTTSAMYSSLYKLMRSTGMMSGSSALSHGFGESSLPQPMSRHPLLQASFATERGTGSPFE
mmetsp:Transcript_148120/g.261202  ORF Transcript_148120/g.261202 Transcript_148120/m.261202 type:complete len:349 (+) Transcript_148120:3520-4566(+)